MKGSKQHVLDGKDWQVFFYPPRQHIAHVKGHETFCLQSGEDLGVFRREFHPSGWYRGTIPGTVHTVLLENQVIPDPYYGRNNALCQWVEMYTWWFRKEFSAPASWTGKTAYLIFDGLDYRTNIYLNGKLIGRHAGMFTPLVIDVSRHLTFDGNNVLCMAFLPPPPSPAKTYRNGRVPQRAFFHRCQMSWGWDWARHLVSVGIWDSVRIEIADRLVINDIWVQSKRRTRKDYSIRVEIEIDNLNVNDGTIQIRASVTGKTFKDRTRRYMYARPIKKAKNRLTLSFRLRDPSLWWPNGYGKQNIYHLALDFRQGSQRLATREVDFAVKDLKMIRNPGSAKTSYPLTFQVNGRKIFARGANWVPPDMLLGRVDKARYERLIRLAKEAHINLFRVWGGGIVEKDVFYQLCDEHGIMIWQDFPLSCAKYPEDDRFLAEKETEARSIIKRLRRHPCVVLWCGGNELFYYGETSKSQLLRLYKRLIRAMHPGMDYHFSSPDRYRKGERPHGPWNYETRPFWYNHRRLFASEVGCNALPCVKSLHRFIPAGERWPLGPSYGYHFAIIGGYKALSNSAGLFKPADLPAYVAASQLGQAESLRAVMEGYRQNEWNSSGCLIWQYNESWPTCAWSFVDYYTVPKIAYYWLKKACEPVHVCLRDNGWQPWTPTSVYSSPIYMGPGNGKAGWTFPALPAREFKADIWVINDLPWPAGKCDITAELYTLSGILLRSARTQADLPPEQSVKADTIHWMDLAIRPEEILLLRVELLKDSHCLSRNDYFFARTDFQMFFRKRKIPISLNVISRRADTLRLQVTNQGTQIASGVHVDLPSQPEETCYFSDQYFCLLPGESRSLELKGIDPGRAINRIDVAGWNFFPVQNRNLVERGR